MTIDVSREKFVDWIANRMTVAGRGDGASVLEVEPSGKYWLGRLQPEQSVAESDWGDRGERLEPCAVGIKLKPSGQGPWKPTLRASARAWIWNKTERHWTKTDEARVSLMVDIPNQPGKTIRFGEEALTLALSEACQLKGLTAAFEVVIEKAANGQTELTISLVNTSPKEHANFKDTRLYQTELRVADLPTAPFVLESLEDSFRYDRRVFAYGINCGVQFVDAEFVTEDAITVDRYRPTYWNVASLMPSMKFDELSADPISSCDALLLALSKWGDDNWSSTALDERQKEESWDHGMRAKADRSANEFFEEAARIRRGIDLLKLDEVLNRSFRGMNRAMSISARGRYDSWRPFQLGFLLANLASIVDTSHEPEIVDVVWFATGGGKTETYLGLIVTAALRDRMTGKTTGITAWSRFPLRMLSLQQTQRFADALAAAEIVRRELAIEGAPFSLGFFVGEAATPNGIKEEPEDGKPDPDDLDMPMAFQTLEYCPFCHERTIEMKFDRRYWKLEHRCTNTECPWPHNALPIYIVDEEIYRFLPTVIVGTLDKAALISMQASMRGLVGPPIGMCSKQGHGYTYAPRSKRPNGCMVPGCRGEVNALPMAPESFGLSFRLQDELHLLRDSLGAVDSHYEALYDSLQEELCGRKPKILASSATLNGYEKQVDVLYRRSARVFPVQSPRPVGGFWTADSDDLMRRFIAIAPRGVTIEYTVDRLLTELQNALRQLASDPATTCQEIGVDPDHAGHLLSLYGTNVVYGNTLRDLEAVMRSTETQIQASGAINTASLTGRTDFSEVRAILDRLQNPEEDFYERIHIISASSMMSHGVDVDRLNVMVMLGLPLSAAEFIQATARVGRRYPGLVFVVHKIGRERDAGVFRSFKQFVEQGDRFVEPIPVTKRSRRVLERTIAGLELARILMIHEPAAGCSLATVKAFKEYVAKGKFDFAQECEVLTAALTLTSELDEPMKNDLMAWFDELRYAVETPPTEARFPSDLSPSGPPMRSLRDVEKQVPVIGHLI